MEIERKFLVRYLPTDLDRYPHFDVEQGYLCTSPTLRVRRMGDDYWLTVKEHLPSGSGAIVNREEEFRLGREQFEQLRAKCDGLVIRKTRYRIDLRRCQQDGLYTYHVAELDLFHGPHEGLRLVEVEFPDEREASLFLKPDWFGDDVSADRRFRNAWLSRHNPNQDQQL